MPYQDKNFNFSDQQVFGDAAATASTNVFNYGSAVKLFQGANNKAKLHIALTADNVGTTPTLLVRFMGADNAALTTNAVQIAGIPSFTTVAGDVGRVWELDLAGQTSAKQYYGILVTQGNDDNSRTINAWIGETAQNNMVP